LRNTKPPNEARLLGSAKMEESRKRTYKMKEEMVVRVGKHESPSPGAAQKEAETHTTRMRQFRRREKWK
jgi:hypothetical protein